MAREDARVGHDLEAHHMRADVASSACLVARHERLLGVVLLETLSVVDQKVECTHKSTKQIFGEWHGEIRLDDDSKAGLIR